MKKKTMRYDCHILKTVIQGRDWIILTAITGDFSGQSSTSHQYKSV